MLAYRAGLFALVLSTGCREVESRPPPGGQDCLDPSCMFGGPHPGGGAPPLDDGGAGGGTADAATEADIAGGVFVLQNEDFVSAMPFSGTGTVGAAGPSGRVTADFVDDMYLLGGVSAGQAVWVDVAPRDSAIDVMPTLQRVDPSEPPEHVAFVRRVLMESIGLNLLLPVELDAERGHIALRFVRSSGVAVAGVRITGHAGETVAYDAGSGVFRDEAEETAESGLAVVLNAPALALPGSPTTIGYGVSGRSESVTVRVARGATTLVTLLVDP